MQIVIQVGHIFLLFYILLKILRQAQYGILILLFPKQK